MQKYSDVVLDKNGKPINGATITVITYPGGLPATIYAADGGPAVTSVSTDQYGRFAFYAQDGHYSFTVNGTGITPQTVNDISLNDPNTHATFAALAASSGASLIGGGSQVVSSISALRALLKTSPSTNAFVTGYYAAGDGGGGAYYYDATDTTSADNGGTVIVATDGGRWKLSWQGQISVKQFGAKGDGVADDKPPIQAAINSGAATIVFPDGTYLVSSQIAGKSNITLTGTGYQSATIKATATMNCVFYFVDNPNVAIERLAIDGNGFVKSNVRWYANTTSPSNFSVQNCLMKGPANDTTLQYGCIEIARLTGTVRLSNVQIANNRFPGSGAEGVIAAYVDKIDVSGNNFNNIGNDAIQIVTCTEITVHDNICTNMGSVGPGGSGISLGSYCLQFSVQGNRIDNAVGDGAIAIELESNYGVVANNTLTNCNHSAIYVSFYTPQASPYDTIRNISIVDNVCVCKSSVTTIVGINAYATPTALGTGLTIKGNVIDGFNQAINISYFTGAAVVDNIAPSLSGSGTLFIAMSYCKYSAIKGNMCYAATTYGAIQLKTYSGNDCDFITVQGNMVQTCGAGGNNAIVYIEGSGTHSICDNWTGSAANYVNCAASPSLQASGNYGALTTTTPFAGTPKLINAQGNYNGLTDFVLIGGKKYTYGAAAPTTGTWNVGDRVFNSAPAVGSPKSWVCTVAGTPGTWVSEGNL